MDMWDPFINAVKANFENAEELIGFVVFMQHSSQKISFWISQE